MKNIIEDSNGYLDMIGLLEEGIDGHAAVIVAHTHSPAAGGVYHHTQASNAGNKIKRVKEHDVKSFGLNQLRTTLDDHGLELKSSHPDALKNLHSNLMKVK